MTINIHSLFYAVLVANFEFAGSAPKEKYTAWTVSVATTYQELHVFFAPQDNNKYRIRCFLVQSLVF